MLLSISPSSNSLRESRTYPGGSRPIAFPQGSRLDYRPRASVLLTCIFRRSQPALYTHRPKPHPNSSLAPYPLPSCIYKIRKRANLIGLSASCILESGSVLSSQLVSKRVLSALKGLTSVFGMGTGGSPSLWPPEMGDRYSLFFSAPSLLHKYLPLLLLRFSSLRFFDQALDRLVPVSSMHCCTSTPGLSTSSSLRGLTSSEWEVLS